MSGVKFNGEMTSDIVVKKKSEAYGRLRSI